jgi:antibiotic biosynthesis monooxygenase (ABM) superfamily enzyme
MYGTIARLKLKPGTEAAFKQMSDEEIGLKIPGFVFQNVLKSDAGGGEYYLVVGFTSRETYMANANSPEQDARYQKWRALMAARVRACRKASCSTDSSTTSWAAMSSLMTAMRSCSPRPVSSRSSVTSNR